MNIGVPSRFACLRIEDEENMLHANSKARDIKKKNDKKPPPKKTEKVTKPEKTIAPKKGSNRKEKVKQNTLQWEEWKEKDCEIVNGHFEEDLQNAIMLSKLDYEHKKQTVDNSEELSSNEKDQNQIKKKKNKVMSLDEFMNLGTEKIELENNLKLDTLKNEDGNFFEQLQLDAKKELQRDQQIEKRNKHEANIDEIITLAQYQEKLELERAKNILLQKALEKAKLEVAAVKDRNKTLCDILGHGEMKDKADVLIELEKLYAEKEDLTKEVIRLHVLLEQERSKGASQTSDVHIKHKEKKRKQKNV